MNRLTSALAFALLMTTASCKKTHVEAPLETPSKLKVTIAWGRAYGGNSTEAASSITGTSDGGYVSVGYTSSQDRDVWGFHGGTQDAWVIKVDATDNTSWRLCIGGSGNENATSVVETSDGGVIVGGVTSSTDGDFSSTNGGNDIFLVKIDKNGLRLWAKTLGGVGDDVISSIIKDEKGNYLVVGGSDDGQAWVFKIAGNGSVLWDKKYGGSKIDRFAGVVANADGSYLAAGSTASNDGDVTGNHGGFSDTWVVKLDNNGNKLWQRTFGGTGNETAHGVVSAPDGGFLVQGRTTSTDGDMVGNHGDLDVFIMRLDKDGNKRWTKLIGGSGTELYSAMVSSNDGGYLVGVGTRSRDGDITESLGNDDGWIFKIDDAGNDLGKQVLGGSGSDGITAIAKGADGSYAITGSTNSYDGDVVGCQGPGLIHDTWILKFRAQ